MTLALFIPPRPMLPAPADPIDAGLTAVFNDLRPTTRRFYDTALRDFADFLKVADAAAAARQLFADPINNGPANLLAMQYRTHLLNSKLAPATISSRLGALAGITKRMRRIGIITWKLDVESVKVTQLKDTAGPGTEAIVGMVETCSADTPMDRRNAAILMLLYGLALRRSEVQRIDFEHIDFTRERIQILGKGRDDSLWVTVPPATMAAVRDWIKHRGEAPGPLFVNMDGRHAIGRLSTTSIYNIVVTAGQKIGIKTRPHGLRHTSGTDLIIENGGDVVELSRHLRHVNINTSMRYLDNLKDAAGKASRTVDSRFARTLDAKRARQNPIK